jgi:hypothetical protein
VTVFSNGHQVRRYQAIVGKTSTPTPTGEFFVEENVRLPGGRPGAPFALATSARSKVFQEFEGGPGQIALHGLTTSAEPSERRSPTAACAWPTARSAGSRPASSRGTR